jgi:asparagine synthase (glutamine-hydrolysing)
MCGIAGILNLVDPLPIGAESLKAMALSLRHRGPDEFGLYRDEWVGLASARLSIVDLAGGQQPIGNETGSLWVVYNGEIFNYPELRAGLEARGHCFSTQCDTEVIVHLYEDFGPDCLQYLNGQFALAVWDAANRRLFLARDRMGIRPLFYTRAGGQLLFGSEIKALLTQRQICAELDPVALREVFTFWSPLSPRTAFRGIVELPPAHYLLASTAGVVTQPYWRLNFEADAPGRAAADYREELESLLIDAARLRLRADVPVGAYLSGGLDSAVTAALIRQHTDSELDTFSIAFSDPGYDERSYQRQMADFLGTRHHQLLCAASDIGRVFPAVVWHAETPLLRTAPAPMFLLSERVHQLDCKVIVTGEGADELLAGYDIFKEAKIRRFWAHHPESQLRPQLLRKLYRDIAGLPPNGAYLAAFFGRDLLQTGSPFYSHQIRWANTARTARFLVRPDETAPGWPIPLPEAFGHWSALAQAQYLEIVTFLSPYLLAAQGDRMSMAHSVEGRYPFLDYRVIEFCNRLPDELKLRWLTDKWLLRELAARMVPAEIARRAKRPYRAPIQACFLGGPGEPDYVRELLSPEAVRAAGYFEPRAVELLLRKARGPARLGEVDEMALVGILSTQLIHHQFVHRAELPAPERSLAAAPDFKIVEPVLA